MSASILFAAAQMNAVMGDFAANARRILEAVHAAQRAGADALITPELALSGYPPEDLVLRPDFLAASDAALLKLAGEAREIAPDLVLIVGHPANYEGQRWNCASVFAPGQPPAVYRKMRLPNHSVFDEMRYFSPGNTPLAFGIKGVSCGLAICEDVWDAQLPLALRAMGAKLLLTLNASPCHAGKQSLRERTLASRVRETAMPALYANLVGGQDELVFDGASFALNCSGAAVARLPQFEEGLMLTVYRQGDFFPADSGQKPAEILLGEEEIWRALVLSLRDYVEKNRFPGVLLGLSGGIDSALCLCLAVDALGAKRVRAVMMPSPYTAAMSLEDSRALAKNLGVHYDEIPLAPAMRVFDELLTPPFARLPPSALSDATAENIQARARGVLLMALSHKTGALVLTTGNKSEMAVGYCTLYGDMAGGFAPLKDVEKTRVYRLARYRNRRDPACSPIPENVLLRPPSAELAPGQTDQDHLPPYEILDAIVEGHMTRNLSAAQLIASGLPQDAVRKVLRLLYRSEYKRRQAPVGPRITTRAFGKDWRVPITQHYGDFG
ncbi:MAG: NAD+ synthase [Zoogloeaceae bacterium]|jgi:NAD+ synthase/NAD+ synthase (glutamine-hydrolysing)|nr:NAD+ synthase [Zoogloeaceae bacterium]